MSLAFQALSICIAIFAVVNGIYLIYRLVTMPKRDLRFGEGQTLQAINKINSDNQIMKKALLDIINATVHVGQDILQQTEIDDYRQVIKELSRDIKLLQSKAYMALDAISEEVPE